MGKVAYHLEISTADAKKLHAANKLNDFEHTRVFDDIHDACVMLPQHFGKAARALGLTTGVVPVTTEAGIIAGAKLIKQALLSATLIKAEYMRNSIVDLR